MPGFLELGSHELGSRDLRVGGRHEQDTISAAKDPDDWVTGDGPITAPQASSLETLAREGGEAIPDDLTNADASKPIDVLPNATGRGTDGAG